MFAVESWHKQLKHQLLHYYTFIRYHMINKRWAEMCGLSLLFVLRLDATNWHANWACYTYESVLQPMIEGHFTPDYQFIRRFLSVNRKGFSQCRHLTLENKTHSITDRLCLCFNWNMSVENYRIRYGNALKMNGLHQY